MIPQDPRRHVFRCDEQLPEVDDLSLIVLKGHLLIEVMLHELGRLTTRHPQYLKQADLSFSKLAHVLRAIVMSRPEDECGSLILQLNSLRNKLVHKLNPDDLRAAVSKVLEIDRRAQPFDDIRLDKRGESFDDAEGLRHAVATCMLFLLCLVFEYDKSR